MHIIMCTMNNNTLSQMVPAVPAAVSFNDRPPAAYSQPMQIGALLLIVRDNQPQHFELTHLNVHRRF